MIEPFCFLLKLRKKKRKGISHLLPPPHHPVTQTAQAILSPLLILLILKVLQKRSQKKERRNIGKILVNTRKRRRRERKARKGLNLLLQYWLCILITCLAACLPFRVMITLKTAFLSLYVGTLPLYMRRKQKLNKYLSNWVVFFLIFQFP